MNTIKGTLKAIYTNRWDLVALVVWPALFLVAGSVLVSFPGGWVFQNVLYALAVLSVCVHAPWVFLAVTAPQTWGKFINNKWEVAFQCLRGDSNKAETAQFLIVWITYLVFVAVLGLICAAVFLGTPSSG